MSWPWETRTSTCRNFATISSGLYRFLAIPVLPDVETYLKSDHFVGGGSVRCDKEQPAVGVGRSRRGRSHPLCCEVPLCCESFYQRGHHRSLQARESRYARGGIVGQTTHGGHGAVKLPQRHVVACASCSGTGFGYANEEAQSAGRARTGKFQ